MKTAQYFRVCVGLPIGFCCFGLALDRDGFMPILLVGSIVYLPLAAYAWWRIGYATQTDALVRISLMVPYASSFLLAVVFAFPELVGGSTGEGGGMWRAPMALLGMISALVVGYLYVGLIWGIYLLLKRIGVVANEFTA